jgi:predicted AAA+ superfamily ATPase
MYLLFDEVQLIKNWEKVINSFRVDIDDDIYITGSNASMLSGELATLIAGRDAEINVFPLSFKEFVDFKQIDLNGRGLLNKTFLEYFEFDGMPVTLSLADETSKFDYLSSTYDSIILRDITSREDGAKNTDTFRKIAFYLMDSISSEISIANLESKLKANEIAVSRATLNNYLQLMEDAFVFFHAKKYDIKGAKQLSTNGKYYICDIGLWNSQIRRTQSDLGSKLENLVFIELLRRKYSIQVGSYNSKEIDFVVTRNNEKNSSNI